MNSSQFEARFKEIVHKIQAEFGNCDQHPTSGDVVEEILLGILGRDTAESKAKDALERLRRSMVDYNELRMAAANDVIDAVGEQFPGAEAKAHDVIGALWTIYERLETLDLTEFKGRPKREAGKWLAEIPGIDAYTLARVMLLCFGAHHVPMNRVALGWLQHYGLFEDSAEVADAQGTLERHVRSADAMKVFCLLQRLADKAPPAPAKPKAEPAPKKKAKAAEAKSATRHEHKPEKAEHKAAESKAAVKVADHKHKAEHKAEHKAAKPAAKAKPPAKPARKTKA